MMLRSIGLRALLLTAALILLALASGCPGDGSALVDGMIPGGIEPTLASIQSHVFGAVCTNCHVPTGPAAFMPLDSEDASYRNLVGVPSLEQPLLDRVEPGDPEGSYLVHKIEGRPSILGDRMPPSPESALTAEQIGVIREWISKGAPR